MMLSLNAQAKLELSSEALEVTTGESIILALSDGRSVKDLPTTESSNILNSASFEDILTEGSEPFSDLTRNWVLELPEGLEFDQAETENLFRKSNADKTLPNFNWSEEKRQLKISAVSSISEMNIAVNANNAGSYEVKASTEEGDLESTPLPLLVNKAEVEQKAKEEKTEETNQENQLKGQLATYADSISPQAGTTVVTNWQEFVEAFADNTVSEISLGNDIDLATETLTNYEELFDTATPNVDTGYEGNYEYFYVSKNSTARALTINGNGFTFDFDKLAIGFKNSSLYVTGSTGTRYGDWNISLQNMKVITSNYSGPFFFSNYTAVAVNASYGITTRVANQTISYASDVYHTRRVAEMYGYYASMFTYHVNEIQLTNDIYTTAGTFRMNYFIQTKSLGTHTAPLSATSLANASPGDNIYYPSGNVNASSARKLIIDAKGYSIDYGSITIHINSGSGIWDITFQDMNIYFGNYWGPIVYLSPTAGKMTFKNFVAVGNQLLESQATTVRMEEKVHISQVLTYNSLKKDGTPLRGSSWQCFNGLQATFAIADCTIADDADVYLASRGTNVLYITNGKVTVGQRAKLKIERGNEVSGAHEYGSSTIHIAAGGTLDVQKDAKVDVLCHKSDMPNGVYLAGATSTINVAENAKLNIVQDAYSGTTVYGSNYNAVYMAGGKINVAGSLNITGTNMGASTTDMLRSAGNVTFIIAPNGSLDIQSDSTNYAQRMIYMAGTSSTFEFTDAERVNLQRTKAMTTGTGTAAENGLIWSAGKLNVSVQNVYQWNYGNLAGGVDADTGFNFAYEPMSKMEISYSSTGNSTITKSNAMTTETKNRFDTNFKTKAQRVLFTQVPDPNVAIQSIANDNPSDPANGHKTVFGYARPGTYIRIWEEAKNGTTSAKPKGTGDNVASPVEDTTADSEYLANFTFQVPTDGDGSWSYTLDSGQFTAENIIHVYGFANLKSEEPTQVVLDKTGPTADADPQTIWKDEAVPNVKSFVKNVADTNPTMTDAKFTYEFHSDNDAAQMAILAGTVGTHTIYINVGDEAGNISKIASQFIVKARLADVTVEFRDYDGTVIKPDIILADQPSETTIDLTSKTEVTDVIDTIVTHEKNYTLETQSWDPTSVYVKPDGTTVVRYIFTGLVRFTEISPNVTFTPSVLQVFTQTIKPSANTWNMKVKDTRASNEATKGKWKVSAQLQGDFEATDSSGDKLTNVLHYKVGGISLPITPSAQTQIHDETAGTTDTTITWQSDEGLELIVPPGMAKAKTYEATVVWSLDDTK